MESNWKTDIATHARNIESHLRTRYGYNFRLQSKAPQARGSNTQDYDDALYVADKLSVMLQHSAHDVDPSSMEVVPKGWEKNDTFAMANTAFQIIKLARQKIITEKNISTLPSSLADTLPLLNVLDSPETIALEYMAAYMPFHRGVKDSIYNEGFNVNLFPGADGSIISGSELIEQAKAIRLTQVAR